MRSNYKPIGQYVRQVKTRNKDLALSEPKGIKITKEFMPSVANTIGTDLSKYRVVSHEQFAYNPMHVGRDEVLPISLLAINESVIVSPAYTVFEIIDKQQLLPEYLMMWCRRPEFDRNAWFTTDSSVRGGFSWKDFCEMELPIPSPEKQKKIVLEYKTIVTRIKLNEQLNQKLEETAQAVYKEWFVDFEFPISAEYASSISKPELEGQPYKSSGGAFIYCEELEQDIPKHWEKSELRSLVNVKHGCAFKGVNFTDKENENILLSPGNFKIGGGFKSEKMRYYTGTVSPDYIFKSQDIMVTMTDLSKETDTLGYPAIIPKFKGKNLLHNQRIGKIEFLGDINYKHYIYDLMRSVDYRNSIVGGATGTTVKHTSPTKIMDFQFALNKNVSLYEKYGKLSTKIQEKVELILIEKLNLLSLRDLLHSKMAMV